MAYSDADRLLTVRGTLTYPDTGTQALTSAHISSFLVNEDAGRDVPVGAAPASSFELKLDNSSGQWEPGGSILGAHILDGAKAEIEIGLWNGATYDYSDIGTYYIDDVQGQEHETLIRLKGSDAMVSLMSEYYADGAGDYPQTLGSLLTDVASVAGVTLESAVFTNSAVSIPAQPVWKNNLTCREAVGYIAACAGGIARFNRAGKLEIAPLERAASRAISTSVYKRLTRENTTFGALNAINIYAYGAPENTAPVRFATTPATPDTSLNSINIKGNPILAHGSSTISSVGTGMLTGLSGMSFRGATFDWHGDPSLVLGKICSVKDLASNSISVLITKQTIKFGAGFEMTSGCDVTTSTKADASNKLQKIFTPTGNLNAEALAGNIYVKAGEKMTLESDGIMNVLSGGEMNIASGGKLTLASGNDVDIGADTLADLLAAATSQTTIWYQDNQPTATATGDIWYDTDATPITIKRWNGSAWVDITTTALSQALTAAGTAQATADGKIKAWAQTTVPSATAVGDLWIDTDDNNKLYRATAAGTGNWVLYKVAAGYVSTSHITIDNDSIDIVSGGDINVAAGGKINLTTANDLMLGVQNITAFADGRIDAKASTIDLSANNSIKLAVSGGSNVVPGTRDLTWVNFQRSTITKHNGARTTRTVVASTATGNTTFSARTEYDIVLLPSTTYTLSFLLDANFVPLNYNALLPSGGGAQIGLPNATIAKGKNLLTFTTPSTVASSYALMLGASHSSLTTAFRFIIEEVQIEKGTHATDWSPAPSDPASGVKTSHITIENNKIDISSGGDLNLSAAEQIKIGTGGTTLASFTNDEITLAVGGIQVGGPNLLRNSGKFADTSFWSVYSPNGASTITRTSSLNLDPWGDSALYVTNVSSATNFRNLSISGHPFKVGQEYTVSFWALYDATRGVTIQDPNGTNMVLNFGNLSPVPGKTLSTAQGTWSYYEKSGTVTGAPNAPCLMIGQGTDNYRPYARFCLREGNKATSWSPAPEDPASGVKTSYIDIATDHIDISSGGNLSITSPNTLKITSGTTNATALAVRNDTDYFISAGHLTQSSAPFSVKRDGSVKATSGVIGGFTLAPSSLSAQAPGKPLLKLDTANSEIILGGLKLFYSGSSEYEFNVGTDELRVTASYFGVVGANVFFDVMDGYAWCNGNMSAASFTDRTPAYTGKNAVAELKLVRNDKNGNIDHSTLPAFARKKITSKDKKGKESEADGRDIGAMISILTKAVQELDERIEKIENRTK